MKPGKWEKRGRLPVFAVSAILALSAPALAESRPPPSSIGFDGAKWIWFAGDKGNPAKSAPAATRYFRAAFTLPADIGKTRAEIVITADNLFTVYANGRNAGENDPGGDSWRRPQRISISRHLTGGGNVLAVEATNTVAGPAGLIAKLIVTGGGGKAIVLVTDEKWKSSDKGDTNWQAPDHFDDGDWAKAKVVGKFGCTPWGKMARPVSRLDAVLKTAAERLRAFDADSLRSTIEGLSRTSPQRAAGYAKRLQAIERALPAIAEGLAKGEESALDRIGELVALQKELARCDPILDGGIVFVRGFLPFTAHDRNNYIQNVRRSRAYFESDTPSPAALGRELYSLIPARPDGKLALLCDAKGGVIGSPSVSYDGKTVYFSMAPKGEAYFHIYRVSPDGSGMRRITTGPFHHFDPAELPDGRIAFSSTRLGSREEYHAVLAFSIFSCDADGGGIRPITQHIVADREPRVTSDGSLAFIRCDNFLERAKVETQIHETRLDGSAGIVILGPGRTGITYSRSQAAEANSNWLRRFGFGSPAAMPDGRVAAISQRGLVVSGSQTGTVVGPRGFLPYDLSPLPDGRLLCTGIKRTGIAVLDPRDNKVLPILSVGELKLPAPDRANTTRGYSSNNLHSVVHLGARPKPRRAPSLVKEKAARDVEKTGYLYCQNVLNTHHKSADLRRIRAIRVYEGRPFTLGPTKHIYTHIGVEAAELGTVPLAPDGSFYARVPADRALALQAVDAEGRSVINELTWIYVRPGEQRSCVGCHTPASAAPTPARLLGVRGPALSLTGQGDPHRFRGNNGANGGVLNLQLDRFREAANINLYAQEPLAPGQVDVAIPTGRPSEVRRLCGQISGGRGGGLKISAIRRLAVFRDRSAVPSLVGSLDDASSDVRSAAVTALAACGNRDAVGPLVRTLSDAHPLVAQGANVALEHLTGHRVGFDAFSRDRGEEVRKWRAWIEASGWQAVESRLVARLSSKDIIEVHEAIEALGHTGGEPARTALRGYLTTHKEGELRVTMAAMRALGHLKDAKAVSLLAGVLAANMLRKPGRGFHELGFQQKPVYLAATAAEALGWIGTSEAERVLVEAFPKLLDFWVYSYRAGDHDWLMGCNSSVLHYRILEAFDSMGSRDLSPLVPKILRSVPLDTDRALLFEPDGYETLVSRVVQRSGRAGEVMETCLGVLGDKGAKAAGDLKAAVTASPPARSTKPLSAEARAAQIASVVCLGPRHARRLRSALGRHRAARPSRKRSWTCFFLARALGKLRDRGSVAALVEVIEKDPTEASLGLNTPPTHILYRAMKPFHRAAAAHALGEIGDARAVPALLRLVADLDNAASVRQRAAVSLGKIGGAACLGRLKGIADDYPELATRRSLLEACRRMESRGGG